MDGRRVDRLRFTRLEEESEGAAEILPAPPTHGGEPA